MGVSTGASGAARRTRLLRRAPIWLALSALGTWGCQNRSVDESVAVSTPHRPTIVCTSGTRCLRLHVILSAPADARALSDGLLTALERANSTFARHGISFQFDATTDFEEQLSELLDHDCTPILAGDQSWADWRDPEVAPECDVAPNERARLSVADRSPTRLNVFIGSGDRPTYDRARKQWMMKPRQSSHSGYFASYVFLTPNAASRPWLLAHELGHYLHLRHPHRRHPRDLAAATRMLCDIPVEQDAQTLFDGDLGFVNDTPPDPLPELYRSLPDSAPPPCAPSEQWEANALQLQLDCPTGGQRSLDLRPPPIRENVMSYWPKGCLERTPIFTPDQGRQMRQALDDLNRAPLIGRPTATPLAPEAVDVRDYRHVILTAGDRSVLHHWSPLDEKDTLASWRENANDFAARAASAPTAIARDDSFHVFLTDVNGHLQHKWWDGNAWGPRNQTWETVGRALTGRPAALFSGPGRLEVFARGTDGHIYTRARVGQQWKAWQDLGGAALDGPSIALESDGSMNVMIRGRDQRAQFRRRTGVEWSPWSRVSASPIDGCPALVLLGEQVWVFAVDRAGKLVYSRGGRGHWSRFQESGRDALLGSPIALATSKTRIDVLIRGRSGRLVHRWFTDAHTTPVARPAGGQFEDLGGPVHATTPAVVVVSPRLLDVYGVTRQGGLWRGRLPLRPRVENQPQPPDVDWTWLGRW